MTLSGSTSGDAATATFMTPEQADAVFSVLVTECKASESSRRDFVSNFVAEIARTKNTSEYRFIGDLGFGGKFYFTRRRWYVSCYPEDETAERMAAIERANVKIQIIKEIA